MTDPNSVMTSVSIVLLKLKSRLKYQSDIYCSIVYNGRKLDTTLMVHNRETGKQRIVYQYYKYRVALKENRVGQYELTEQEGKC